MTLVMSISIPSGVWTENRVVAVVSRASAVGVAAMLVALVGLFEIEAPSASLGAPVVNAIIVASPSQTPRTAVRQDPPAEAQAVAASAALADGDAEWPHLWTYDAMGRIVFRSDEQLARCLSARYRGQEQSDCPDSNDRTPMISSQS